MKLVVLSEADYFLCPVNLSIAGGGELIGSVDVVDGVWVLVILGLTG
jgi:hypothetical protein